jgi:FkbM family methyltransferase
MAMVLQQAIRIYEGMRRGVPYLHPFVRKAARISVRTYAILKGFQLPPDQPYNYQYLTGTYEPGTTMLVSRLLRRGMIAVDIGAHAGYYTRLFAKLVGKDGKVYAFEPAPQTFDILERNTKIFPNVQRFNAALLDRDGIINLYESVNSGANSIWPNNTRGAPARSVTVQATTLDQVFAHVSPHLIKIDVEGAELEVLHGMQAVLHRSERLVLIIEWNPSCLKGRGEDPALLIRTIAGFGFDIAAIDELTGKVESVNIDNAVESLLKRRRKYINLLCTRR